jgi:hypothetical protein
MEKEVIDKQNGNTYQSAMMAPNVAPPTMPSRSPNSMEGRVGSEGNDDHNGGLDEECWTEPGTMNVPGVHKSELIKKTFQS